MKKVFISAILCLILMLCSCAEQASEKDETIDFSKINNICNIATMECYYHNVATLDKVKGEGIKYLFDNNQECWIEYSGTVTFGIDGSKVKVETTDDQIVITIPRAEILRVGFDENNEFKVYSLTGNAFQELFNKNKITAEDRSAMIKEAQETMQNQMEDSKTLINAATDKAKDIIEDYINTVCELSNKEYKIVWKDI